MKPTLIKLVILFIAMFAIAFGFVNQAYAYENSPSAIPVSHIAKEKDMRAEKLEAYLASHNSPLAPYADTFIEKADTYSLDWRLVAAISGVESTFGKNIPYNSYNAYGWNGGNYAFDGWEDGIETVSRDLRQKYMDKWKADEVYEIGRIYCPPSKVWANNVMYFMNQIELGPKDQQSTLALKLAI